MCYVCIIYLPPIQTSVYIGIYKQLLLIIRDVIYASLFRNNYKLKLITSPLSTE